MHFAGDAGPFFFAHRLQVGGQGAQLLARVAQLFFNPLALGDVLQAALVAKHVQHRVPAVVDRPRVDFRPEEFSVMPIKLGLEVSHETGLFEPGHEFAVGCGRCWNSSSLSTQQACGCGNSGGKLQ